jgi:hypothetical protein
MSQSNSTPVTMPGSPLSETINVDIPNQLNDNMDGVEMGDANDVSPTTSVVQTAFGQGATNTEASQDTAANVVSDSSIAIKSLMVRRTEAIQRYTSLLTGNGVEQLGNEPDAYEQTLGQLIKNIDTYNHHIDVMTATIAKKSQPITASTESTETQGTTNGASSFTFRLTPGDLPKFQLKGDTVYYPGEDSYDSVEHFLRTFEKTISSSGYKVENIWKQCICHEPIISPRASKTSMHHVTLP